MLRLLLLLWASCARLASAFVHASLMTATPVEIVIIGKVKNRLSLMLVSHYVCAVRGTDSSKMLYTIIIAAYLPFLCADSL
jgi:hypothetical protein